MLVWCMGRVSRSLVILDLRRRRSTERRYVEILTIVVVLVAGERDVRGFGQWLPVHRPLCGRIFHRFLDIRSIIIICGRVRRERVPFQFASLSQCNAMPPMKCINPMIQVEYLFGQNVAFQCVDGYSVDGTASGDTSFSASCSSDGSWTLSNCRPITCGSFSSPANVVTSPATAFC